jgi:formiminotetrahydrofolate cyclodeaminase
VAEHGTKHALSDAAASAILANAALRCALLNIDVNAALIKKTTISARLRSESARLEADGRALSAQTLALIASR